jgi:ComF family protein
MNPLKNLMDIIYPQRCHACGAFLHRDPSDGLSRFFCITCHRGLVPIASSRCTICSRPFVSDSQADHPCEDCLRKRPLYEAIHAPFLYEGILMDVIHRFKYGGKSFLAESLGLMLAQFAEGLFKDSEGLLIMPVPIHRRRLRERGFNQSLLLARHVSNRLKSELDFLSLRRLKYTAPQTGLDREQRQRNVRGAFDVASPPTVRGRNVLLVDDVATTGNTLNECARVLIRSGCKSIVGLALARAG